MVSLRNLSARQFRPWTWLALLISVSVVLRYIVAYAHPAPWILDDELLFIEAAKSIARPLTEPSMGRTGPGLYFVYPALIAPAFAIFDQASSAYAAAKFINCILMSSAAVPAYLLARRVLTREFALVVALLTLAVPSMIYTAAAMTENAYYPAFLWCSLAFVRVLERPSNLRQFVALGAIAFTFLIRNQAITFVPALVLAFIAKSLIGSDSVENSDAGSPPPPFKSSRRSWWQRVLVYRTTWITFASFTAILIAGVVLESDLLKSLAAQNQFVLNMPEDFYVSYLGRIPRTLFAHIADLDLYLGVLPLAAFAILAIRALRGRSQDRALADFICVSLSITICNLLMVALFLALVNQPRIADRNFFFVAPFFFIALCRWAEALPPKKPWFVGACIIVGLLPLLIDFGSIDREFIVADSLALVATTKLALVLGMEAGFGPYLAGGTLIVACALLLPRKPASWLPLVTLVFLVVLHAPVVRATYKESHGAMREGVPPESPEWVDALVGKNARVASLWHGAGNRHAYWQNSFFNKTVTNNYEFYGPSKTDRTAFELRNRGLDRLSSIDVGLESESGALIGSDGFPIEFDHILTHSTLELSAELIAEDEKRSMALYKADGPVEVLSRVTGVGNDGWTGESFGYTVFNQAAGLLSIDLHSSPDVHLEPRTVIASIDGLEVSRTTIVPGEFRTFVAPYPESFKSWSRIEFGVSALGEAAFVPGRRDGRSLGLVVKKFERLPRPPIASVFISGIDDDGWTLDEFELAVASRFPGQLSLSFWAETGNGIIDQSVVAFRDGEQVLELALTPGTQQWYGLPFDSGETEFTSLHFEVTPPFIPDDAFGTGDRRALGLLPGHYLFVSPAGIATKHEGVYHDRWTAPRFRFAAQTENGGELVLDLESNYKIFPDGQTIIGRIGEREVLRGKLTTGENRTFFVQVPPDATGCQTIEFEVWPTTASSQARTYNDPRELGLLCRGLSFLARE